MEDKIIDEIKEHFEGAEVDTKMLLNKLKPTIVSKCERIKEQKKGFTESGAFTMVAVAVFIIGLFVLFPEYLDFADQLVQFAALVLLVLFCGGGTYLLVKESIKIQESKNIRLRGKLS